MSSLLTRYCLVACRGLLWIIEASPVINRENLAKLQKLREKVNMKPQSYLCECTAYSSAWFYRLMPALGSYGNGKFKVFLKAVNSRNIIALQLSKDYQAQRQAVDKITYELKSHVDNYTLLVQSGEHVFQSAITFECNTMRIFTTKCYNAV